MPRGKFWRERLIKDDEHTSMPINGKEFYKLVVKYPSIIDYMMKHYYIRYKFIPMLMEKKQYCDIYIKMYHLKTIAKTYGVDWVTLISCPDWNEFIREL